jgi:hypothetical protein
VVIVSHQDPIQAGRLRLLGAPLTDFHTDQPALGAVITLRPGASWTEETTWEPGKSPRFGEKAGLRVPEPAEVPTPPTSA